jgi:hypothetical protein
MKIKIEAICNSCGTVLEGHIVYITIKGPILAIKGCKTCMEKIRKG